MGVNPWLGLGPWLNFGARLVTTGIVTARILDAARLVVPTRREIGIFTRVPTGIDGGALVHRRTLKALATVAALRTITAILTLATIVAAAILGIAILGITILGIAILGIAILTAAILSVAIAARNKSPVLPLATILVTIRSAILVAILTAILTSLLTVAALLVRILLELRLRLRAGIVIIRAAILAAALISAAVLPATIMRMVREAAVVVALVAILIEGARSTILLAKRLLGSGDYTKIMFRMLKISFGSHRVAGNLSVTRELAVFFGHMLRGAAYFNVRTVRLVATRQRIGTLATATAAHTPVLCWSHGCFSTFNVSQLFQTRESDAGRGLSQRPRERPSSWDLIRLLTEVMSAMSGSKPQDRSKPHPCGRDHKPLVISHLGFPREPSSLRVSAISVRNLTASPSLAKR